MMTNLSKIPERINTFEFNMPKFCKKQIPEVDDKVFIQYEGKWRLAYVLNVDANNVYLSIDNLGVFKYELEPFWVFSKTSYKVFMDSYYFFP